jgi:peptidoglycan L-alanyl-D-glutamate endopeptidase CwlK
LWQVQASRGTQPEAQARLDLRRLCAKNSEQEAKMSRNIDDLQPKVAALCHKFIAECSKQGIDVLVTCTLRTDAEQAALYAQGRTKPGTIVTNAKPGQSLHNYACAFDFVPIVHGKPLWDDHGTFEKCGVIGEKLGLEWSGRWSGPMREQCHLQYTQGLTLADFRAGKRLA